VLLGLHSLLYRIAVKHW